MELSPRDLVELLLLGPTHDRRQLQDSPILGDVWIAFADRPDRPQDLLITPHVERSAGRVAGSLARGIQKLQLPRNPTDPADAPQIAYLQGLVAARLFFLEIVRVVVPLTKWWKDKKVPAELKRYRPGVLETRIAQIVDWTRRGTASPRALRPEDFPVLSAPERYLILGGILLAAGRRDAPASASAPGSEEPTTVAGLLAADDAPARISRELDLLVRDLGAEPEPPEPQVWQVSLNRRALAALDRSVPSVKGDAAKALFKVNCGDIRWAVVDSGIDGRHPVFHDEHGKCRIVRALDFRHIRKIVSLDNLDTASPAFALRCQELSVERSVSPEETAAILTRLANDAAEDRPILWELVEKLVEIPPTTPPPSGHGTHVAGILAANRLGRRPGDSQASESTGPAYSDGMCPDLRLYDFRVLGKSLDDTEFAIIAALQYIRHLNDRHGYLGIHGVNLSLSIPHDVRNFACGRTPVCNECERLVESGVVVVAAAGNLGYQSFETGRGRFEGYAAFSVTDPGNAESVLTVGATHRSWPHTYGISFFSSRGPTGDGRLKPDLVAPGERIQSSLPGGEWGELDGTSMAAPHVSGAAAMLMARYAELIGQPRQIKRVLCESATDLGRERSFQGHGMLDVLRAFQKI